MIQLRTLGRLDLTGTSGEAAGLVMGQPKRAGLLAYLALAEPRGFHRRDSLVALFWPEMDATRARQSLRQAVYVFRKALGKAAVLSRGDEELAINREVLGCDAIAFEEGIVAGRAETVLDSYAGDFLAGFFVSGAAAEFDEWVAAQRQRLRSLAANGAWAVGLQEERAGNAAGAAHWARRAASFTPDDEEATRDLMILLARVGDRSGALRTYDALATRLLAEYDATPALELRKLAEEMRSEAGRYTRPMHPPPPGPRVSPAIALRAIDRQEPAANRSPRKRWTWIAALAGFTILAGAGVATWARAPSEAPVFAVGEINDHTGPDSTQHASAFADLLATSIGRLPRIEVLGSPRLYEIRSQGLALDSAFTMAQAARSGGAGRLLEGDLRRAGNQLVLDLRIVDLPNGRILRVLRVQGGDPFDLADRAAGLLATELQLAPPTQPLATITTRSLVALRMYEQGLGAYYTGDFGAAARLFSAAVAEDSSFGMAAFYLAKTAMTLSAPGADSVVGRAVRLASRATDHDRLLVLGTVGLWSMRPEARAYAETLAVRYPSDVDGQLLLGETRSISGDYAGAVNVLLGVIRTDSLSLNLQGAPCRACDAYFTLVDAYREWDSMPAALRTAREWVNRSPHHLLAWNLLSSALAGAGRPEEYVRAVRMADSLSRRSSDVALLQSEIALHEGRYASAEAVLRPMLTIGNPARAVDYRWFLIIALWQQGRFREALELTASGNTILQARAQGLFNGGDPRAAAAAFLAVASLGVVPGAGSGHAARHVTWNFTHAATAFAAAGDTGKLASLADSIEQYGALSLFGRDARLHHYVRGLLAHARNDLTGAEREFRAAVTSWNLGYTRINYELARVLMETGRASEAVRILQPAFRGSIEASNLYITRTELHELLARAWDAAGNRDSARAHWRAVVEAWRGADPPLQPRWQAAVAALAKP
ncbi:MAG: BTAD domain-containing putative transcriptional regulator [Gemmatimonadota bacterium]